jgi:hypothetical protein
MARGWESKSVEDQMGAAEAAKDDRAKLHLSQMEREQETVRQSLLLSRVQIAARLKKTTNARYRAQLERSLEHLDQKLRELDGKSK